jgi:hypothetical protein
MEEVNLLLKYISSEETTETKTNTEINPTKLETALAKFTAAKEAQ